MAMHRERSSGDSFQTYTKLMEHLLQYETDMRAIGQDMSFLRAKLEELQAKVDGIPSDEQLEDGQPTG